MPTPGAWTWGRYASNEPACASYDQALTQDAAFTDFAAITVVVSSA